MRNTQADTRRALLQALALHVVLFGLMFAGLQWTRSNVAETPRGEAVEADLVDPDALSAAMQRALARAPQAAPAVPLPVEPPPEPLPEPMPEDALPPPEPDPAPVEQPRVQPDADSPLVAEVPAEQQQQRTPPPQADLDAERRKQQQLAELRRQRQRAAGERSMAEQRARQLADARMRNPANAAAETDATASAPRGNPDATSSRQAAYVAALRDAITRHWTRPESVLPGQKCRVLIRQIPGGEVVSVEVVPSCPYDALGRRSVEAAVLKASPLPYAGFEDVFIREVDLRFDAADL